MSTFQSRMPWIMGALAGVATLAAVGFGLNGMRGGPPPIVVPAVPPPTPSGGDAMAPRLFNQTGPIRVHVAGAVKKPGVYSLPRWARVVDGMAKAGGAAGNADLDAINLADPLRDGEQLRIPSRGRPQPLVSHQPTPEPPSVPPTAGGRRPGRYPFAVAAPEPQVREPRLRDAAATGPVNLNTATQEELESLPGIGPATAEKILAHRQANGPFQQVDDLLNVPGIGPGRMGRLRGLVQAP